MNNSDTKIAILRTLLGEEEDGRWGIRALRSLALKPQNGFDPDFFKFESEMEHFNCGSRNIHEMCARPQQEMAMIRHQTICRDAYTSATMGFSKDFFKR